MNCSDCRYKVVIGDHVQCILPNSLRWGQMTTPASTCEYWKSEKEEE